MNYSIITMICVFHKFRTESGKHCLLSHRSLQFFPFSSFGFCYEYVTSGDPKRSRSHV